MARARLASIYAHEANSQRNALQHGDLRIFFDEDADEEIYEDEEEDEQYYENRI